MKIGQIFIAILFLIIIPSCRLTNLALKIPGDPKTCRKCQSIIKAMPIEVCFGISKLDDKLYLVITTYCESCQK